jgi:hypothetical protein
MFFLKNKILFLIGCVIIIFSILMGCKRTPVVAPSDRIIYIPKDKAGHYAEGWLFKDKNEIKSICDALSAVSRKKKIPPDVHISLADCHLFLFLDDKGNVKEEYYILGDKMIFFPDDSRYWTDEPVKKMKDLISKGSGEKLSLEQIRSIKGIEKYINFEWVEMEAKENKE